MTHRLHHLLVAVSLVACGGATETPDVVTDPKPVRVTQDEPRVVHTPRLAARTVDCDKIIDEIDAPPERYVTVLGSVALDGATRTLQVHPNPRIQQDPTGALFAKSGLLVRAGESVTLEVPAEHQDVMSISWGYGNDSLTHQLTVPACSPRDGSDWVVFAGGYFVTEPARVSLIVRKDDVSERIAIAIGHMASGLAP